MMKNMEWGAVAYLSHSEYGIGTEVRINNTEDIKTGYSAAIGTNQETRFGDYGQSSDKTNAQPWDSTTGYLASTTGNISGIYDMNGGSWEYMAACVDGIPLNSGFDVNELNNYINLGYIDKYASGGTNRSFNNRILGDATGEMGPFYQYYDGYGTAGEGNTDGTLRYHSSWYNDFATFVTSSLSWFYRGGMYTDGGTGGQFSFGTTAGAGNVSHASRLVLASTN